MRVFVSGLLAVGILATSVPALAVNRCVAKAAAEKIACKQQCQTDFSEAKLRCRNVDPACGDPCVLGLQTCLDTAQGILETGLLPDGITQFDSVKCPGGTNQCDMAFNTVKTACGAPCQLTDTTCLDCVDAAQVARFTCRDACRDSWRLNTTVRALLNSCHSGFRTCWQACPKLKPTPTP